MVLLDKTGSPAPSVGTGKSWDGRLLPSLMEGGYLLEAEIDDIKANCVLDNNKDIYFDVLCSVGIDWMPHFSPPEEVLPDLGHDLAIMSDKQEHTDVSFNVRGESFSAHRLVLAARSPVFKAELYGPMAESRMTSITIQDMEASTFRSMLHYLYHGSLPNNAGKIDASSIVAEYQHVLIAADRYGIERLKKICEAKLSSYGITIDSVVSMLELAEHHHCSKLKAVCFDFLADGDNFKMVATSGEYLQLMQTFPTLLIEAHNRFKAPHEKTTTMEPASHKKTRMC
jgi:speckle-type POZ protein